MLILDAKRRCPEVGTHTYACADAGYRESDSGLVDLVPLLACCVDGCTFVASTTRSRKDIENVNMKWDECMSPQSRGGLGMIHGSVRLSSSTRVSPTALSPTLTQLNSTLYLSSS